jgi:hypothetical protein
MEKKELVELLKKLEANKKIFFKENSQVIIRWNELCSDIDKVVKELKKGVSLEAGQKEVIELGDNTFLEYSTQMTKGKFNEKRTTAFLLENKFSQEVIDNLKDPGKPKLVAKIKSSFNIEIDEPEIEEERIRN